MFDFKGKLSKECEDFLFNKQRKMEVISIGFISAIFSIFIMSRQHRPKPFMWSVNFLERMIKNNMKKLFKYYALSLVMIAVVYVSAPFLAIFVDELFHVNIFPYLPYPLLGYNFIDATVKIIVYLRREKVFSEDMPRESSLKGLLMQGIAEIIFVICVCWFVLWHRSTWYELTKIP